MVFFTCNACGESLKKGQVEKHLVICRNCSCLSCIDCGKDFVGDSYKTHLKCITEDEKYGGKAFEAKASKGDVKQQQWIQRIQEILKKPNISDNIRKILNQISTYDNVPRKKAKFQNWMKNSLRVFDQGVQDKVWEIFAEAQKDDPNNNAPKPSNTPAAESKAEPPAATEEAEKKMSKRERKEERQKKNKKEKKDQNSEEPLQNGTKKKGKKRKIEEDENNESNNNEANDEEAAGKKKKKKQHEDVSENGKKEAPRKKKKRNDSQGEEQEEEAEENGADEDGEEDRGNRGKFNWKGTIKALLKLAPDHELPIKKLRKKVIAQYYVISSEQHKSEEELLATFNKKIKNNPKFRVLKEKVKLVK